MEGRSWKDEVFDQGTNREALIPSGVRKRPEVERSGLGPSRKEEGRGMILKTSYSKKAILQNSKFKIQNYETGNVEADRADSDFDTDCTGDDAGSDELYVGNREMRMKAELYLFGFLLYFLYSF